MPAVKECVPEGCSRRFMARNNRQRFCTPECRFVVRTVIGRDRYDRHHKALRAELVPAVRSGTVNCSRCELPIEPHQAWDLDHSDDGVTYRGPSHTSCNRAAPNTRAWDPAGYQDDEAKCVYWGRPLSDRTGSLARGRVPGTTGGRKRLASAGSGTPARPPVFHSVPLDPRCLSVVAVPDRRRLETVGVTTST